MWYNFNMISIRAWSGKRFSRVTPGVVWVDYTTTEGKKTKIVNFRSVVTARKIVKEINEKRNDTWDVAQCVSYLLVRQQQVEGIQK